MDAGGVFVGANVDLLLDLELRGISVASPERSEPSDMTSDLIHVYFLLG